MARISDSIVCQNIECNLFVAAFPGQIVIGFLQKDPSEISKCYVFENQAYFTRSNFHYLASCLQNVGKVLSGKKSKSISRHEEYEYEDGILQRNGTNLYVQNKITSSSCTFDLSRPEHFQKFCDAIFAVVYSTLLPTNEQYDACCKINLYFREHEEGMNLPPRALENAQKELRFSAPIYHYLRRNRSVLEFAYAMSTLADTK